MQASDVMAGTALVLGLFNLGVNLRDHRGRRHVSGHVTLTPRYRTSSDQRWVLHEVDPATSDEERARWDVPPLAEALRRADQMSRNDPPAAWTT